MSVCKKMLFAILLVAVALSFPCFSQEQNFLNMDVLPEQQESSVYADALNAYGNNDWQTSIFLFKKLHSNQENITPESLYLLIMAETFSGQYKYAVADCDLFLKQFPHNQYVPLVKYQKGKNLYHQNDYEKSILTLSDFCHENPKHKLYSSALFWIAESFYATYNFDSAKPLYERIVLEFPDEAKTRDAQFRLDIIVQRGREEKLLYLLKQTGEDYLSSKESYEKALKQYQMENSVGVNSQLRELRQRNENLDNTLAAERQKTAELEAQVKDYKEEMNTLAAERQKATELEAQVKDYENEMVNSIKELKIQAEEVYKLLGDE